MMFLVTATSFAQVTVSGALVGNGTYTSLTLAGGAFAAINGGTQTGAAILITITADVTTETGATALNAGAWTTLTINPSGARTISGTISAKPIIDLNGADNVTIDGLNTSGNSLTISNTNSGTTSNTCTIRFIADATNNTITNCTILGSFSGTLATNGGNIFFSTGTTTGNDNNTISKCSIGPAGTNYPSKAIYINGSTTSSAIANSNITINNCQIYDFFLAAGCAGVYALTGTTDLNVTNNKIYQTGSRAITGTMSGIYFANSTYGNNVQITGNKIGYANGTGTGTFTLTSTGSFQGIYLSALITAAQACSISNDTISDISCTSSTGTFTGIVNTTGVSTNTINITNNIIRNVTLITTTGNFIGISWGSASIINITGNTVSGFTRNGAGSIYGIYSAASSATETVSSNIVYNISSTAATATTIRGISQGTATGTKNFQNNIIHDISGAAGSSITGLYVGYATTANLSGNTIYTLTSTGGSAGSIYGIQLPGSSVTTMNVYKNKIYDLSMTSTGGILYGINVVGGTTNNIYNNLIGDLRLTAVSAALPLAGIYVSGGTNANLDFNTIYLNASSSGTLFGTTCIYASATTTVDMRDNIMVNTSTPIAATGFVTAYRRSSNILTSYASTSNNNLFYAGTPGTYNLIMYDGTNSYQTIAAYKTAVGPTRDAASFTENPPFASTTGSSASFLHINPSIATQVESGGTPVTGITDDFDGNVRNVTTPDVGADEGTFSPLDLSPPAISYTPLPNTATTGDRTLSVTITDPSLVGTGANQPVLYWKINSAAYTGPVAPTSIVGNVYTYTFGAGAATPDVVSYFVVAQDQAPATNVGSYPTGATVTANPPLASAGPASPSTYQLLGTICGSKTIGATGADYATITLALADLNAKVYNTPQN